ncbi:TMEM175 family protein [Spongiivirga citrea]|uniref:DUF1211 domain-containing protein n=1 Tax=Spongiivirga citrea TaxID=1481457 RepID=A0A6M0CFJ8_9FLAO|nr:TMEM175 family protein [Spongiivirga citrea]NER16648.1 DUF1211 domain-containing protein [Spongiivirga citrea]
MYKETFEKGRVINFSDAVFSIAMTILVLEISVPGYEVIQKLGTLKALQYLIPNFIGFFVSFMVIALYWIAHLKTMRFVDNFSKRLLWLNIYLLLFVVLLPFSTSFFVVYVPEIGPFNFYCLNLIAIGFTMWLNVRYVLKTTTHQNEEAVLQLKWQKWRSISGPIIWSCAIATSFISFTTAVIVFSLIFISGAVINRIYKKKLNNISQ